MIQDGECSSFNISETKHEKFDEKFNSGYYSYFKGSYRLLK